MKTILSTLFVTVAVALTASASPLSIEINVTERGKTAIHPSSLSVKSGQEASVQYGDTECVFTPTLLADGSVEINAALREHHGKHTDEVCKPHFTAKLGECGVIEYGDLAFQMTTSLAK